MARGLISAFLLSLVIVLAGPAAGSSAAIVGLERVAPVSTTDSNNKGVTATCPAGKRLVGAGGDVTPGSGQVLIDEIRPSADLTSVTVHAVEDPTGSAANWYVQAFATCAYAPPGLQLVTAPSAVDSASKAIPATCPGGKRLLGAGADINPANGEVLFDDIAPDSGLTAATVSAVEDEDGYAGAWSVTAYAICSAPIAGLSRVATTSVLDSSVSKVITTPCPTGRQVLGSGGTINSSNGQIILDALYTPNDTLTSSGYAAWEDRTGNSATWSLTAYAICANSAELVTVTTPRDSFDGKDAHPTCPTGHRPTGGGFEISGGPGQVSATAFPDASGGPFFVVSAVEDESRTDGIWSLRGFAICATPYPGAITVEQYAAAGFAATASCPGATRVLGMGGLPAVFGFGDLLHALRPDAALTAATAIATRAEVTGAAEVVAYAMCATAPPGLQLVTRIGTSDAEDVKYATASCPAGKHLVGAGGEVVGASGHILIDDVRPNAALTTVTVTGAETETGIESNWYVRAHAICVTA